jgi:chemotaxis protein MotB
VTRQTWIIAGALAALVTITLLVLKARVDAELVRAAHTEALEARAAADANIRTNLALTSELVGLRQRADELQQQIEQATQARLGFEQQMRAELESRDVTISELQGRLTVSILDRVLFDSGEARLKAEGQAVLLKIGQVFSRYPNRQIQVIGHTDNVPIRGRTPEGFTDNWALSAGRATAAVRYLRDSAGVDPKRLSAVGCGEFRPVADNATAEGRALNRRIAVVLLPEEIAPADPARSEASVPTNRVQAVDSQPVPTEP